MPSISGTNIPSSSGTSTPSTSGTNIPSSSGTSTPSPSGQRECQLPNRVILNRESNILNKECK